MRRVDIAYLYEHASRELDVACAVTARLRNDYGLSVQILHWPQGFSEAVASLKPRLVTLPFCYSERSYVNLLHFWNESLFFNLTWEQLLYPGNQKAKTPRGEFALRHVVHHAWSEAYAGLLRDQGIPDEHIFCNGQPAYALYDEPYRRYFPSRAELAARYGLDERKRWIFFPENYNWAFYSDATLQRFLADGQSLEDITEMRDFCNRSLHEVLNWCRTAAMKQDVEIILRPRPSTTLERFRHEVEQSLPDLPAGLHMIQDESVRVLSPVRYSLDAVTVEGRFAVLEDALFLANIDHDEVPLGISDENLAMEIRRQRNDVFRGLVNCELVLELHDLLTEHLVLRLHPGDRVLQALELLGHGNDLLRLHSGGHIGGQFLLRRVPFAGQRFRPTEVAQQLQQQKLDRHSRCILSSQIRGALPDWAYRSGLSRPHLPKQVSGSRCLDRWASCSGRAARRCWRRHRLHLFHLAIGFSLQVMIEDLFRVAVDWLVKLATPIKTGARRIIARDKVDLSAIGAYACARNCTWRNEQ